ncbi:MAG: sigma 54-interacting transcriptional regulator, partial [Planctomycetaceae bacterium]|nr:sigma 54-interacting transcriptional regulator [Planctomycetaceae bacterium]
MYSAQMMDQNISRLNEELQRKLDKISEQQRHIALLQSQLVQLNDPPPRKFTNNTGFQRDACKGSSPAIIRVLDTAKKVASSESSVLLRGESGTGKEVLARVLHKNSPRANKPMIRVHCASLSPSLLESELFGHVKGAFTGAHQDREGRFEAAHGGTLFLD